MTSKTLVGVWSCQWTWMLGYPDQAVHLSDEKDAHARRQGDAFNLGFALTLGAYAFDYRCEPEPAARAGPGGRARSSASTAFRSWIR